MRVVRGVRDVRVVRGVRVVRVVRVVFFVRDVFFVREFREIREFRESSVHSARPIPNLPKLLKFTKHYQENLGRGYAMVAPLPNTYSSLGGVILHVWCVSICHRYKS